MNKTFIRTVFERICNSPYFSKKLVQLHNGCKVIVYHGVECEISDQFIQHVHIPIYVFEKQIKYLKSNFEIITLDYLNECLLNNYRIDPNYVAITFDDGYKNNLEIVCPLLYSENIPFSVFISTNHISSGNRFPSYYLRLVFSKYQNDYIYLKSINKGFDISTYLNKLESINYVSMLLKTLEQQKVDKIIDEIINLIPKNELLDLNYKFSSDNPMNWEEIECLNNYGVIIGSHNHDHFIPHSNQIHEEIDRQLITSKIMIEQRLGQCKYLAYPNGHLENVSCYSRKKAKEHYSLAFSTVPAEVTLKNEIHFLPRLYPSFDLSHFKFILNTCICKTWLAGLAPCHGKTYKRSRVITKGGINDV